MAEPYHVSNSQLFLKFIILLNKFICLIFNSAVTSVRHGTDLFLLSPWGFFLSLFWIGSHVFDVFFVFIYSLILMEQFYQ